MSYEADDHLHMLFFPYMAQGHMLPMIDMAKIFGARGARITIFTTAVNASIIRPTIDDSIHLHIVPFPTADFGLPEGCENRTLIFSADQRINFFKAIDSLRRPFDSALEDLRPDCVVTDMLLPWTYHLAAARDIPRLVFHGTSNLGICAASALDRCWPLADEANSFVLPGLPHRCWKIILICPNPTLEIIKFEVHGDWTNLEHMDQAQRREILGGKFLEGNLIRK